MLTIAAVPGRDHVRGSRHAVSHIGAVRFTVRIALPRVGRDVADRAVATFAAGRVVHEHGEAARARAAAARRARCTRARHAVRRRRTHARPPAASIVATTAFAARLVASGDAHRRALGREAQRDRASDARRRSGDERSFSRQPHGGGGYRRAGACREGGAPAVRPGSSVSTSTPDAVVSSVCSNCAVSEPSAVTAVHPSGQMRPTS